MVVHCCRNCQKKKESLLRNTNAQRMTPSYHYVHRTTTDAVNVTIPTTIQWIESMDVGNGLLIFFLMILIFSFVALLINMLVSCCDESLVNDTDSNAVIIAASLNSRLNRLTSHNRFRYDIPYDANERRATLRGDSELPMCNYRYGYTLPPAPEPIVSPFSRASSHRSGHSSAFVELPLVRKTNTGASLTATASPSSEEPPPSYDEVVGRASSHEKSTTAAQF